MLPPEEPPSPHQSRDFPGQAVSLKPGDLEQLGALVSLYGERNRWEGAVVSVVCEDQDGLKAH